jgi:hypothetical protein
VPERHENRREEGKRVLDVDPTFASPAKGVFLAGALPEPVVRTCMSKKRQNAISVAFFWLFMFWNFGLKRVSFPAGEERS